MIPDDELTPERLQQEQILIDIKNEFMRQTEPPKVILSYDEQVKQYLESAERLKDATRFKPAKLLDQLLHPNRIYK